MDKDPEHNGNELQWLSIQHKRVSWEGTDEVQSIFLMKAFNYKTQQESCELMSWSMYFSIVEWQIMMFAPRSTKNTQASRQDREPYCDIIKLNCLRCHWLIFCYFLFIYFLLLLINKQSRRHTNDYLHSLTLICFGDQVNWILVRGKKKKCKCGSRNWPISKKTAFIS